ncbi:MAG: hypothetical protein JJE39_03595 [Vicinamibacteria bacterium]|nr:hypothetical protein [Vicinamibacteria bacterium]
MFHQTIQDILALTGSGPRTEDILDSVRSRIMAFEPFESGELLARSDQGCRRFVLAPGLGDTGDRVLGALGDEATLRIDTAAEVRERGLEANPGLASLLILRLDVPPFDSAAVVLSHRRAWSFAAASLFRIRTLGNIALRLVAPLARTADPASESSAAEAELSNLRNRVSSLEAEIIGLRVAQARPGSDKSR